MRTWQGWTATVGSPTIRALTWSEWCAQLQRSAQGEQRQGEQRQGEQRQDYSAPLSERQLARLSFVRWLYQTGRFGPREQNNV